MRRSFKGLFGQRKTKKGARRGSHEAAQHQEADVALEIQESKDRPPPVAPRPTQPPPPPSAADLVEIPKKQHPEPAARIGENVFEGIPGHAPSQQQHSVVITNETPVAELVDGGLRDDDDAPQVVLSYQSIPLLEQTKLPRGGCSVDTKAVGRVQVGWSRFPPSIVFRNSHLIDLLILSVRHSSRNNQR